MRRAATIQQSGVGVDLKLMTLKTTPNKETTEFKQGYASDHISIFKKHMFKESKRKNI